MSKKVTKKPSRAKYEEAHPVFSARLDRETYDRLKAHLSDTGCSLGKFIKDSVAREETMVKERVTKMASRKIIESEMTAHDLELYDIVLDVAYWLMILWVNLPKPLEVPCPNCLFPSPITKRETATVMLQMQENSDLKCPQCGLVLKIPPQLAWVLLVSKVAEEVRREKLLNPRKGETDGGVR
jgi:hypothetical protein